MFIFRRLKINHESHEFILDPSIVANSMYVWSLCQAFKDFKNKHEILSSPRVHTFAQTSYLQAVERYNEKDEDREIEINKHRKRKRMC